MNDDVLALPRLFGETDAEYDARCREVVVNVVPRGFLRHEPLWNTQSAWDHQHPVPNVGIQEVIDLCRSMAIDAGKGTEFLDAMAQFRPYVTREDALARVGLDPTVAETVFMMGVQEERRVADETMGRINRTIQEMARGFGLSADNAVSEAIRVHPSMMVAPHADLEFSLAAGEAPVAPLNGTKINVTINPPDTSKKP